MVNLWYLLWVMFLGTMGDVKAGEDGEKLISSVTGNLSDSAKPLFCGSHYCEAEDRNYRGKKAIQFPYDRSMAQDIRFGNFYGLYTGYCTSAIADFVKEKLVDNVKKIYSKRTDDNCDMGLLLKQSFYTTEEDIQKKRQDLSQSTDDWGGEGDMGGFDNSGTSALVALLCNKTLHIAHAGCPVAILVEGEEVRVLTKDHLIEGCPTKKKDELPPQGNKNHEYISAPPLHEIMKYGRCLWNSRSGNTSYIYRGLGYQGESYFSGTVSCEPEVSTIALTDKTKFLIMASRAAWPYLRGGCERNVALLSNYLKSHPRDVQGAARQLCPNWNDWLDRTALVIDLASYVRSCKRTDQYFPKTVSFTTHDIVKLDHEQSKQKDIKTESDQKREQPYSFIGMSLWKCQDGEDTKLVASLSDNKLFLGVFDGHGGREISYFVAKYLKENLKENLNKDFETDSTEKVLTQLFLKTNVKCLETYGKDCEFGSTGVVAFFNKNMLSIAHVGDSRAVLCTDGRVEFSTQDHDTKRSDEYERIIKAGGRIDKYSGRVGYLAMTRAFGDFSLSSLGIIAEPEISSIKLDKQSFLILASDGILHRNKISNEKACAIVSEHLSEKEGDVEGAAKALVHLATIEKVPIDDRTVLVVDIRGYLRRISTQDQATDLS